MPLGATLLGKAAVYCRGSHHLVSSSFSHGLRLSFHAWRGNSNHAHNVRGYFPNSNITTRVFHNTLRRWKSNAAGVKPAGKSLPKTSLPKTSDVARLIALAKPEKWTLAAAVALLLISSGVTMALPYAVGQVVDIISSQSEAEELKQTLSRVCRFLGVIFVVGAAANFGRVYLLQSSGQRIVRTLRRDVYAAIIQQESAFFDETSTGELVNRLAADTSLVAESLTQNLSDGLRSTAMVVTGVSMMFYVSTKLAFIGLTIVPIVGVIVIPFGRKMKDKVKSIQAAVADSTQIAQERISNVRTVKAFSKELAEVDAYSNAVNRILVQSFDLSRIQASFYGLNGLIGNSLVITVLYSGGILMTEGAITVGQLSSFLLYVVMVAASMNGLSSFFATLTKSVGASARLFELADRRPLISLTEGVIPETAMVGSVSLRDVGFSYPARPDACIFSNLNLEIDAGTIAAVVGASGSGKSTVGSLLMRMYDTDQGEVCVDGVNVQSLNPCWLREQMGLVAQEPILFSASVYENIAYGARDPSSVTLEAVKDAAAKANALGFIQRFPDGMDTKVGERGIMLSGGQKQRVAIARAILRDPRILILDEATSALDAESEYLVQDALDRLMVGRTVITIAHRLSTIRSADTIHVLGMRDKEGAHVVEKGTYSELVSLPGGVFRGLVERQTFG